MASQRSIERRKREEALRAKALRVLDESGSWREIKGPGKSALRKLESSLCCFQRRSKSRRLTGSTCG